MFLIFVKKHSLVMLTQSFRNLNGVFLHFSVMIHSAGVAIFLNKLKGDIMETLHLFLGWL